MMWGQNVPMLVMTLLAGFATCLSGCGTHISYNNRANETDVVVAEGPLLSVKYDVGNGKTGGFTRLNQPAAVPGDQGSWNVNATGKLTSRFLLITYQDGTSAEPHAIPVERLYEVRFGMGGIEATAISPRPATVIGLPSADRN